MSTVTAVGFDIDTLMDVITWAEVSEQYKARRIPALPPEYEKWGLWDQTYYAMDGGEKEVRGEHAENREVCGTAFCIAGQVAWQNNYRMLIDYEGSAEQCVLEAPTGWVDSRGRAIWEDVPGAEPVGIDDVASSALGITDEEADYLFNGDNSLDDLKEVVNLMCRTRGLPLAYPDFGVHDAENNSDEGW